MYRYLSSITDRAITNPTFDQRLRGRTDAYAAGTVDHAIADDGLGEEWEGRRGFIGFDCNSGGHGG